MRLLFVPAVAINFILSAFNALVDLLNYFSTCLSNDLLLTDLFLIGDPLLIIPPLGLLFVVYFLLLIICCWGYLLIRARFFLLNASFIRDLLIDDGDDLSMMSLMYLSAMDLLIGVMGGFFDFCYSFFYIDSVWLIFISDLLVFAFRWLFVVYTYLPFCCCIFIFG